MVVVGALLVAYRPPEIFPLHQAEHVVCPDLVKVSIPPAPLWFPFESGLIYVEECQVCPLK